MAKTASATSATRFSTTRTLRTLMWLSSSDAVGAFGHLAGGVGSDGRTLREERGVDGHVAAGDEHLETIEPPGRGTVALLADAVVLRAVARALEPLRGLTPRDAAAEVHALLVQ